MHLLHVGPAVLNQRPLDWPGNLARMRGATAEARAIGATVVCLPELCASGYNCEDMFLAENTRRQAWNVLQAFLPDTAGLIVAVGLPILYQNAVFNAAAPCVGRELAGPVPKQHLAGDGVHYEPRWFKAWPAGRVARFIVDDVEYPLGDLLFDVAG